MASALFQDFLNPIFLADVAVPEELDGQPLAGRQFLGTVADLIAERFGELGLVEDADLVVEAVVSGRLGMADVGEGPRDDHPIQARQDIGDLLGMPFDEVDHGQLGVGG
jgi:hypothetical protein